MFKHISCRSCCIAAVIVAICHGPSIHASSPVAPTTVAIAADIGVAPESLVIAGIASSQCSTAATLLHRIDSATSLCQGLQEAYAALDAAGATLTSLLEAVSTAPDDEALAASLHSAQQARSAAEQTLAAQRQALRSYVLENIASAPIAILDRVQSNAARSVPAEFRVLDLSDDQWRAVQRALRAERRATRVNMPLDSQHAQLLQEIRAEIAVIDAKYKLTAHLAAVETAFEQTESE